MIEGDGAIWLVGCGNMAGAMLARWIATGLDPRRVTVVRPSGAAVADGVRVLTTPPAGPPPELLLLGVKPQKLDEAAAAFRGVVGPGTTILSILTGVERAAIARRLPGAGAVVRVLPNTPVAIGRGVVLVDHDPASDATARARMAALLAPLGLVQPVADVGAFDAYSALAGCGTAYLYRFVDALAAAGATVGVAPGDAARLALAVVEGAAALAAGSDEAPAALARRVASPGGSTQAGFDVLDRDGALVHLMTDTLNAARARNAELGAAAR